MQLRRRLIWVLCAVLGISYATLRSAAPSGEPEQASPPAAAEGDYQSAVIKQNLVRFIQAHHQLLLEPERIALIPLPSELLSPGRPYLVAFSATPAEREGMRDLFLMRAQLGANGSRLSSAPPKNLSQNERSHDDILLASREQLIYGQEEAEGCRSITYLSFRTDEERGSFWEALAEIRAYDLSAPPERYTLRFRRPTGPCRVALTEIGFEAFNGPRRYTVDLIRRAHAPSDASAELIATRPPAEEGLDLVQRNLNAYELITERESLSISKLRLNFHARFESFVYELFVNREDPRQFVPVGEVSSVALRSPGAWIPPRIDVEFPRPGEGRWRARRVAGVREPLIQETFIRLDPAHPYLDIRLYAFDMRRLGLHFVGGADPLQESEGVGSAQVPTPHRASIIAAFNGGPVEPRHGMIEDGHELRALQREQATVLLDELGRSAFGRWDLERLPLGWVSARQSASPLFDDRQQGASAPPPQSLLGRLDEVYQTRSALGVTDAGALIFAWARSATAEQLSRALRLTGVRFAMSLRAGSEQSGLAFFSHRGARLDGRAASSQMRLDLDRWLDGSRQDFFYLVRSQSLPLKVAGYQEGWQAGEGIWRPILHQSADPWLASTYLSAERCGQAVRLLVADGRRLQPLLSPGPHFGPQHAGERPHQNDPVMLLPIGLPRRDAGLMKLEESVRPLREGSVSFAVDREGGAYLGLWGSRPLTIDREWVDVIQGEQLLKGGELIAPPAPEVENNRGRRSSVREDAEEPTPQEQPLVALGAGRRQRWLFATSERGGRDALACALKYAGVEEAMLLTETGTVETGRARFFFKSLGPSYFNRLPSYALESTRLGSPESALLTTGAALLFTARPAAPRARAVESFQSLD